MINPEEFYNCLNENEFELFTGVPDSLLKDFCACLSDKADDRYIISANEGNAIGIAAGYYLGSGKPAVVFMQNSGIGNAVNPLLSLIDEKVYSIPVLIIVGWRGEPGVKDEPQHIKQGEVTFELFETMKIETILLEENYEDTIKHCADTLKNCNRPIALIVRKGTFSEYSFIPEKSNFPLSREEALNAILECTKKDDIIVSTTGKTSRELYELRKARNEGHENDFLTVGSMGHASSIALGISISSHKNVYCIDGDGAFIMHMGANAVNANVASDNFHYIVINNGAHESVGGQPTVGLKMDIKKILEGCGFNVYEAYTEQDITECIEMSEGRKSALIIYVHQGSRKDLGRPQDTPIQNKNKLMAMIKK